MIYGRETCLKARRVLNEDAKQQLGAASEGTKDLNGSRQQCPECRGTTTLKGLRDPKYGSS